MKNQPIQKSWGSRAALLFFLLLTALTSNAQQRITVTGIVTAQTDGSPLPGVNIAVKNTTRGTLSDFDGNYAIEVEADAVLVFSSVSFKSQEIPVNNRQEINVTLVEEVGALDEVIVIGYGTQRKSDLTGSVVSLREEDLNSVNTTSVDEMLQGRAPGVQITQSSHAPGGGSTIRIRGTGSINAGNEPLYVIDGLPIDNRVTANGAGATGFDGGLPATNPLNTISPSDIASIEILKDASATAIYGSRGANGVILITTKTGKAGKFSVEYNTSVGISTIANKIDVLGTADYIRINNELAIARGGQPVFSPEYIQTVGQGTDWQDQIFRSALTNRQDISLSGNSGQTTFYTSLSYTNQEGIVLASDYKRYQGRVNLNYKANERFSFGINFNTSLELNNAVPVNGFGINQDADAINSALNTPPIFPIYNEDGSFFRPESGQVVSVTLDNPLAILQGQTAKDQTNRTIANIFGNYAIIPDLIAKLSFGTDRSSKRRDVYISRIAQQGQAVGGAASILNGDLSNVLVEGTLTYTNTFKEDHALTALIGSTYQKFEERVSSAGTRGFASDVIETNNLGLGDREFNDVGSFASERILISYLSRINYSYRDRYLFTGSIRADGSSNFGSNNKYGYFPSFSGAWKISEEGFLANSGEISSLKLRIGWGQIGNDDIGIGSALSTFTGSGSVVINDQLLTAISPARIPNPDLKWETSEQTNIGLDFGFFKNRLSGSVDYFKKTTKDLLLNLPIPSSSGFASITKNVGQVNNSGLEVLLTSRNLTGDFSWETTVNLTTLKNEVDNLGTISEIVPSNDPATIIRPGVALFSYYGLQAEGIFQTEAEVAASAQSDLAVPGVPRWRDVNNDGTINDQDRVVLGNPYPDFSFGFSNDFTCKNLSLTIFFEGAFGMDLFHWQTVDALYANDPYRNRLAEPLLNRWTPENPSNSYPSGVNPTLYQGNKTNSLTVLDASYVRLKNVRLAYRLPLDHIRFINSAQVFVAGQNLAVFTDYPGFDPDVNSTGRGNIRQDRNAYPSSRTYVLGFNINL